MSQTRLQSLVEAIANTAVGFGVAFLTQLAVFPFFGISISFAQNVIIGIIFTAVSIVRSYAVRRLFNYLNGKWANVQN